MRKILVCLKRVVDYSIRIRVKADRSGVATEGVKMAINPFDEIALEEALRLKEGGSADEVVVLSIGSHAVQEQIRTGLAMGADRAIIVETDEPFEPLAVACVIHAVVQRELPGLVLMGKQSIDGDNNQTGQMLAALWRRPQATFASRISIEGARATVTREVDAGLETIEVELPAVVTADLRLNEPRYIKLPEILKAKRKPLETLALSELGIEYAPQFTVVDTAPPPERGSGIKVGNATELLTELDKRGLV
jgi:electron transfer flavoprotein beta subunit